MAPKNCPDSDEITPFEMGLWRLNQRMLPFVGSVLLACVGYTAIQLFTDHDRLGVVEGRINTVEVVLGINTAKKKSPQFHKPESPADE